MFNSDKTIKLFGHVISTEVDKDAAMSSVLFYTEKVLLGMLSEFDKSL